MATKNNPPSLAKHTPIRLVMSYITTYTITEREESGGF
jgi:hypothetical protein